MFEMCLNTLKMENIDMPNFFMRLKKLKKNIYLRIFK